MRKFILLVAALMAVTPVLAADKSSSTVVAYYFHSARRCPTCRTIETFSAEAIRKGFAAELKSGALQWRVVNVDEPDNRHFIKDFNLYASSLVLVSQGKDNPRWKNLDRVWSLVGDPEGFARYVENEVRQFRKGP